MLVDVCGTTTSLYEHFMLTIAGHFRFSTADTNSMTGNIPSQLGLLSKLEWLDLGTNKFSGQIPVQLGNLGKVESMYLVDNQLTGTIPASFANLSGLTDALELDSNNFQGGQDITGIFCDATNTEECDLSKFPNFVDCYEVLWVDCEDSGQILCDCCNEHDCAT